MTRAELLRHALSQAPTKTRHGIFISILSPFLPNIKRTSGEHECHPHVSLLLA